MKSKAAVGFNFGPKESKQPQINDFADMTNEDDRSNAKLQQPQTYDH